LERTSGGLTAAPETERNPPGHNQQANTVAEVGDAAKAPPALTSVKLMLGAQAS
jgi:hypothetical protein